MVTIFYEFRLPDITHLTKEAYNLLSLTFEKVKSAKKAKEVLEGVGED
jgi:hypothetical protein